jgi:hypothetical protein
MFLCCHTHTHQVARRPEMAGAGADPQHGSLGRVSLLGRDCGVRERAAMGPRALSAGVHGQARGRGTWGNWGGTCLLLLLEFLIC